MSFSSAKRRSSVCSVLVLGLGPGLNRTLGNGLVHVRDDQVHVEVNGIAETRQRGHAPKGLLKENSRGSGSFISRCGSFCTRICCEKRNWRCVSSFALASPLLRGAVWKTISPASRYPCSMPSTMRERGSGGNGNAIHQNVDILLKVHVQQRFRRGEIKDLAFLVEAVVASSCARSNRRSFRRRGGFFGGFGF